MAQKLFSYIYCFYVLLLMLSVHEPCFHLIPMICTSPLVFMFYVENLGISCMFVVRFNSVVCLLSDSIHIA
jgi:hypothetical protein